MVFYVFLEPGVISDAAAASPYGIALLINIFKGFQRNCLIVDFQDMYSSNGVQREVAQLDDAVLQGTLSQSDVKLLKAILVRLKKAGRFAPEIAPDWTDPDKHMSILASTCESIGLDALLLAEDQSVSFPIETATLSTYTTSNFENRRSSAADGRVYPTGYLPEFEFMPEAFGKSFQRARRIDVYDGMVSRHWGSNYQHTLKSLVTWLKSELAYPSECKLVLHTESPKGQTGAAIEHHLDSSRRTADLGELEIEVQYYDERTMPHDRFIVADSFAIGIGRGMDFLDHQNHVNRDVTIAILDTGSTSALFDAYEASRQGNPVVI